MGVLYYFEREDDSIELFALNKVYHYAMPWINDYREWKDAPTVDEVVNSIRPESEGWARLIHVRVESWAGGKRIRCISENEDGSDDLTYEEDRDRITGSAHSSDYEDDGVTYIGGSAW